MDPDDSYPAPLVTHHPALAPARHEAEAVRADALRLAAELRCDWRTARRAVLYGADSLRSYIAREAARRAMRDLGITPRTTRAA